MAVGLGEQHGDGASSLGELVAVGAGDPLDELFAAQPPQVVSRLPGRVAGFEEGAHPLDEGAVVEAGDQVAAAGDGGHQRHRPGIPEPQGRGVLAIAGERRLGHLVEGGHVGSGLCVGGVSVTQTLAGVLAKVRAGRSSSRN